VTIGEVGVIPTGDIHMLVMMEVVGNGVTQDYTDTEVDMADTEGMVGMADTEGGMVGMVGTVVVTTKAKFLIVASLLIHKLPKDVDVILERATMADITLLITVLVTIITITPFKDLGRLVTITLEMIGQIGITITTISNILHI
jgi:hypothetical protein